MNYSGTQYDTINELKGMQGLLGGADIHLNEGCSLNMALELARVKPLEVLKTGFEGMLELYGKPNLSNDWASDDVIWMAYNTPVTVPNVYMLLKRIDIASGGLLFARKLEVAAFAPKGISSLINDKTPAYYTVSFYLPDTAATVHWHVRPSDTLLDFWRQANACLLANGCKNRIYYYTAPSGCYFIIKPAESVELVRRLTQLSFSPVPDPEPIQAPLPELPDISDEELDNEPPETPAEKAARQSGLKRFIKSTLKSSRQSRKAELEAAIEFAKTGQRPMPGKPVLSVQEVLEKNLPGVSRPRPHGGKPIAHTSGQSAVADGCADPKSVSAVKLVPTKDVKPAVSDAAEEATTAAHEHSDTADASIQSEVVRAPVNSEAAISAPAVVETVAAESAPSESSDESEASAREKLNRIIREGLSAASEARESGTDSARASKQRPGPPIPVARNISELSQRDTAGIDAADEPLKPIRSGGRSARGYISDQMSSVPMAAPEPEDVPKPVTLFEDGTLLELTQWAIAEKANGEAAELAASEQASKAAVPEQSAEVVPEIETGSAADEQSAPAALAATAEVETVAAAEYADVAVVKQPRSKPPAHKPKSKQKSKSSDRSGKNRAKKAQRPARVESSVKIPKAVVPADDDIDDDNYDEFTPHNDRVRGDMSSGYDYDTSLPPEQDYDVQYDSDGNPITYYDEPAIQYYDENGNPVDVQYYDDNGNPVNIQYYDEYGNPVDFTYDDGEYMYGYDEEFEQSLTEELGYEAEYPSKARASQERRFDFNAIRPYLMTGAARAEYREREYQQVRESLIQLARLGIRMNEGFVLRDVLRGEGIKPRQLIKRGWEGLLWFLSGVDLVRGKAHAYSDDILLYCYEDYSNDRLLIELTHAMQRMTKNALAFGRVSQKNDKDGRPSVLSFVQGGKKHRWRLRTDTGGAQLQDYFERMSELMEKENCPGSLWYLEAQTQCYYMYLTRNNALRLRRLTGLPVQPVYPDR